ARAHPKTALIFAAAQVAVTQAAHAVEAIEVRDVPGRKVLLQREGRGQKVELIEFFASLPQGRRELVPFPQLLFEIGVKDVVDDKARRGDGRDPLVHRGEKGVMIAGGVSKAVAALFGCDKTDL